MDRKVQRMILIMRKIFIVLLFSAFISGCTTLNNEYSAGNTNVSNESNLVIHAGSEIEFNPKTGEALVLRTNFETQLKEGRINDLGRIIVSFKGFLPTRDSGNMPVESYGNTLAYGKEIIIRLHGEKSGFELSLPIERNYYCSLASKNDYSDYSNYVAVVLLIKSDSADYAQPDVRRFFCEIGGDDPIAGARRFPAALMMSDKQGELIPICPIGKLPGTRVVLGQGVTLTLECHDGNKNSSYVLSGGDAFEITLDNQLQIFKK